MSVISFNHLIFNQTEHSFVNMQICQCFLPILILLHLRTAYRLLLCRKKLDQLLECYMSCMKTERIKLSNF